MKRNLRSSLSFFLIFDKTYSCVCNVDPLDSIQTSRAILHQRCSFAEKAQAVTLGGLSASLGGATTALTGTGLSLARRGSGRGEGRRRDNGRRHAAGGTPGSSVDMLVVGADLPAESNPVQLLNTVGVHARRLVLPVQLVLTTLALDPANSIEDMKGVEFGISQCFEGKTKSAYPIAWVDKRHIKTCNKTVLTM